MIEEANLITLVDAVSSPPLLEESHLTLLELLILLFFLYSPTTTCISFCYMLSFKHLNSITNYRKE